jgi:hypothetical protein
MEKFQIEVSHDKDKIACYKAVKIFLTSGSHFLVNADWGCKDKVHKAYMTIEAESREEARRIIPSAFRSRATIVQLNKFTWEEVNENLTQSHE